MKYLSKTAASAIIDLIHQELGEEVGLLLVILQEGEAPQAISTIFPEYLPTIYAFMLDNTIGEIDEISFGKPN